MVTEVVIVVVVVVVAVVVTVVASSNQSGRTAKVGTVELHILGTRSGRQMDREGARARSTTATANGPLSRTAECRWRGRINEVNVMVVVEEVVRHYRC